MVNLKKQHFRNIYTFQSLSLTVCDFTPWLSDKGQDNENELLVSIACSGVIIQVSS